MKTTIQIDVSTLDRLKALKHYMRESYDELLNNLIDEVREEELSPEEIVEIQEGLEEVKRGKTKSIEQVAKELGVSLE